MGNISKVLQVTYCFVNKYLAVLITVFICLAVKSTTAAIPHYPTDSLTPLYEQAAQYILSQAGVPQKGYCFDFGAGQSRLAYQLSIRSDFYITGIDDEPNNISSGRNLLHDADIYGDRITLRLDSLSDIDNRDYAAVLVVSDSIIANGTCTGSAAEMFRMVRPDGGMAIIGQPPGCPNVLIRSELENWLDADGLSYTISEDSNGLWAHINRGPLSGAGEWTHTWADLGNTGCSGDTRITDNFKVLWFGGPGPRILAERHARGMTPLYKAGRLVVPGIDCVVCVDAYSGARLWDLDVPDSDRMAILRDAGWLTMDGDYVYAASEDNCRKVDLDTGEVVATYNPPVSNKDWGYVAIDGDLLYGSAQITNASRMHAIDIDCWALTYYNRQPIVTSKVLFCRNRNSNPLDPALWMYDNSSVIANPSICVSGDAIYFFESVNSTAVADADGLVLLADFTDGANEYLVKLNKNTGTVQWRLQKELPYQNLIHLSYANNILLASGTSDTPSNSLHYNYRAYNAGNGSPLWSRDVSAPDDEWNEYHGAQDHHTKIIGDTIYLRYGNYSLQTGVPLGFTFETSRCADCSASATHIFTRYSVGSYGGPFGGGPSMYNINGGGSGSFIPLSPVMRPGCYISIVPAGGIIMMPAYGSSCICQFSLDTSVGWLPQ